MKIMKKVFFEVDVPYREKSHELQNDLSFLLERMRNERVEKNYSQLA